MKINENKIGLYYSVFLGSFLTLFLTYDIIITNILSAYYCNTTPNPKTKIEKKVEYPISIYWEDNVYPGFSKEERELMINNYLDGVHLKIMVLNTPDGDHVYVYTREVPISKYNEVNTKLQNARKTYMEFNTRFKQPNLQKENKPLWLKLRDQKEEARKVVYPLEKQRDDLIKSYQTKERVYSKQSMPKTNYTLTFNEVKLNPFARHFLYSDESKVIENNTSKVIAYNRRYMALKYMIVPNLQATYYNSDPMCGERVAHLEYKTFHAYPWSSVHLGNHQRNLHEILIKKYGEN